MPKKASKTVKKKAAKKKAAKKTTVKKTTAKAKKSSSLADRLKAAKKSLEDARRKSVRTGEGLFRECVRQLFKEHPGLETFSWDEYTPHWNDGDECTFGTYFDSLSINGEEDPECVYTLEHMNDLLSNRQRSETRIVMELTDTTKDKWEIERLKSDLEIVRTRDPKEVAEKYKMKKAIHGLLTSIDDSVYEGMFGEGTVVVTRDGIKVEECEHD